MKVAIILVFAVAAVMAHPAAEDVEAITTTTARPSTTTARPSTTTARPSTTTVGPVEKCPAINGVYVTVIPNPADCTTYFACETGVPILMHCPAGLHFNPVEHVCDLPANAKCQKV